jgi:PAS domain-containing protein
VKDGIRRASQGEFVRHDVEIYGSGAGEDTIIIDYSLIPIFDRTGEVVMLLAEGRNITEKKRAEAEIARKNHELQRLLDRLRELDEVKTQFFANVSHELRTPLPSCWAPWSASWRRGRTSRPASAATSRWCAATRPCCSSRSTTSSTSPSSTRAG